MYRLKPYVAHKVWGGERLVSSKGLSASDAPLPVGETWEVSTYREATSFLEDEGVSLRSFLAPIELSYLVKFIDTAKHLSVQVHPNDEHAQRLEGEAHGKSECWLVLQAQQGAGVYLGLRPGADVVQLKNAVNKKEDVSELLNFVPVEAGDFFYVQAGTIHAIGSGVTLLEVQESSDITYRVWDWNRVGPDGKGRELHIEKALSVIDPSLPENSWNRSKLFEKEGHHHLISHKNFKVELHTKQRTPMDISLSKGCPQAVVCLAGGLELERVGGGVISLGPYQTAILCEVEGRAHETMITVRPQQESHFVFIYS